MEPSSTDIDLVTTHVARVKVHEDQLAIQLSIASEQESGTLKETATQQCEDAND
jgi:hypothetical protein